MQAITVALFVAMFLFCSYLSGNVQAYLDPGTGSMALQLLVGGVVAVLATLRVYWGRLKSFTARKRSDSGQNSPISGATPPASRDARDGPLALD
jgi:hypothetical protein